MTSTSCASSVSGQKSSPQSGVVENRSKSCDTSCTSNSSCFFKRRKPMNPLAYSLRPTHHKTNPVKQRVMSAKLLKLRQLQSQLNDANYHLAELNRENQTLKTLQKRQDKALSKYENTNADLPRLIHSHEEEIRVLSERNKTLRKNVKELSDQLKLKEEELSKVKEQLNHLERLNREKHLTEREKLKEQMEDFKIKLQKSDEQVAVLNRKLLLESKTSKQRLNGEIAKHKQCQKELLHAFDEIDRLSGLLDAKENAVHPRNPKFTKFQGLACLKNFQVKRNFSADKVMLPQTPVTEVKLEPLNRDRKLENGFKTPMENIRQRLSGQSDKLPSSGNNNSKSRPTSVKLDKLVFEHEKETQQSQFNELNHHKGNEYKRSDSLDTDKDVDELVDNLDSAIQKATENSKTEFDKKLGNYCSEVLGNVKSCSKVIELHKDSLESSKNDTSNLLESFQQTEKAETKLKHSFFSMDDDMDFVKEILSEEHKFQMENQVHESDKEGKTVNKKKLVNLENKKKLLATLRAIDNGDSVDSLDEHKQNNIIKEIFGHVTQ